MSIASWIAPANIALIKYWGMRDADQVVPWNPSISMTLSQCVSHTSVGYAEARQDEVWWWTPEGLITPSSSFSANVLEQVRRLKALAHSSSSLKVVTVNHFPSGAGIASSASGFAALTLATCSALGLSTTAEQLSRQTRLSGSGSATRSLLGGFVQWPGDASHPDGPAHQIAPAEHWPLRDLIAVIDAGEKPVSSREGHRRAPTSPYFVSRQQHLPVRTEALRQALMGRDFARFADLVEQESIDLHVIAMTGHPPTFYFQPATLAVLKTVRELRAAGLQTCATLDAGPNVHVLCTAEDAAAVLIQLRSVPGVAYVIEDSVGLGPRQTSAHLF